MERVWWRCERIDGGLWCYVVSLVGQESRGEKVLGKAVMTSSCEGGCDFLFCRALGTWHRFCFFFFNTRLPSILDPLNLSLLPLSSPASDTFPPNPLQNHGRRSRRQNTATCNCRRRGPILGCKSPTYYFDTLTTLLLLNSRDTFWSADPGIPDRRSPLSRHSC